MPSKLRFSSLFNRVGSRMSDSVAIWEFKIFCDYTKSFLLSQFKSAFWQTVSGIKDPCFLS